MYMLPQIQTAFSLSNYMQIHMQNSLILNHQINVPYTLCFTDLVFKLLGGGGGMFDEFWVNIGLNRMINGSVSPKSQTQTAGRPHQRVLLLKTQTNLTPTHPSHFHFISLKQKKRFYYYIIIFFLKQALVPFEFKCTYYE